MTIPYPEAIEALRTAVDLVPLSLDDPKRSLAALREVDAAVLQALFAVSHGSGLRMRDRELFVFATRPAPKAPPVKLTLDDINLEELGL